MKSQYIIIIIICTALTTSMLFLAYVEKDQREQKEDFWSVYFIKPLTNQNDFVIDNRSKDATFQYTIYADETLITSNEVHIEKNTRKLITLTEKEISLPVKITVTRDNKEKIIEKK